MKDFSIDRGESYTQAEVELALTYLPPELKAGIMIQLKANAEAGRLDEEVRGVKLSAAELAVASHQLFQNVLRQCSMRWSLMK
jgi:hypothetical protein